ncbi:MAG: DUF2997 domain-containing protein [Planctomycetota bacterium]
MSTPTTKTIEITVSPEGATSIKTSGFTGGACRDATRDIERALGVAGRESLLPEFYDQTDASDQVQQGQ